MRRNPVAEGWLRTSLGISHAPGIVNPGLMIMFEVSSVLVKDEAQGSTGILELRGWAEHQNSTKTARERKGDSVCGGGGKRRNLSSEGKS